MSDIKIFEKEEFGKIRVSISDNNEPLFCATDIASALGYQRPDVAIVSHCKSGELVYQSHANGVGGTKIKYIKETDVYRLIMKSELESAEKFQDWVCEEVLPSIRKNGAYMTDQTIERALNDPDFLIQLATNLKEEKAKRIQSEKECILLQEELDESKEWYTIKRWAAINRISWRKYSWRELKRLSIIEDMQIRKIFDANYGEVNLYHRNIFEKYEQNNK